MTLNDLQKLLVTGMTSGKLPPPPLSVPPPPHSSSINTTTSCKVAFDTQMVLRPASLAAAATNPCCTTSGASVPVNFSNCVDDFSGRIILH